MTGEPYKWSFLTTYWLKTTFGNLERSWVFHGFCKARKKVSALDAAKTFS